MEPSRRGEDENWFRVFIEDACGESSSDEFGTAAPPLPSAWMGLVDGPSPGKSIGSIGPYRIDQRIGRGGMGVVFKAWDTALKRFVAIKVLMPRLAVSPLARVRFAREAQAAAAIKHPNIVRIYSVGEHEGLPYFVMEYVEGITLADRVKREGMLERKSILRIGSQIARGLAAAHDQGLIHRDIKPANILLENGLDVALISDFGLACVMAEAWRLTASGVLLGTPTYMSPEQAAGAAVDHRSDLFSLGSLLYHLCTGEPPFSGPSVMAILDRVLNADPRPIRDLNPDIPTALEGHIRRLMAKDPADRFPSANELARTLVDFLAETQGRKREASLDDPDDHPRDEANSGDEGRGGRVEVVDSGDDLAPSPKHTRSKLAEPDGRYGDVTNRRRTRLPSWVHAAWGFTLAIILANAFRSNRDPSTPSRGIQPVVEARKGPEIPTTLNRRIESVGAPPLVATQRNGGTESSNHRSNPRGQMAVVYPPDFNRLNAFGRRVPDELRLGRRTFRNRGLGPQMLGVPGYPVLRPDLDFYRRWFGGNYPGGNRLGMGGRNWPGIGREVLDTRSLRPLP
jgi:serine/threonine protein kinase